MRLPFKKKTVIDQRIREIENQMTSLHKELRLAERHRERPLSSAFPADRDEQREEGMSRRSRNEEGGKGGSPETVQPVRDDRFANYLASSFQTMHPLKQERRIQRNKAIVMVVFVAIMLFLVVRWVHNVFLS